MAGDGHVPLYRDLATEVIIQDIDVITHATKIAHQPALEDDLRIKARLARIGIPVDDFEVMQRYAFAEWWSVGKGREH